MANLQISSAVRGKLIETFLLRRFVGSEPILVVFLLLLLFSYSQSKFWKDGSCMSFSDRSSVFDVAMSAPVPVVVVVGVFDLFLLVPLLLLLLLALAEVREHLHTNRAPDFGTMEYPHCTAACCKSVRSFT